MISPSKYGILNIFLGKRKTFQIFIDDNFLLHFCDRIYIVFLSLKSYQQYKVLFISLFSDSPNSFVLKDSCTILLPCPVIYSNNEGKPFFKHREVILPLSIKLVIVIFKRRNQIHFKLPTLKIHKISSCFISNKDINLPITKCLQCKNRSYSN